MSDSVTEKKTPRALHFVKLPQDEYESIIIDFLKINPKVDVKIIEETLERIGVLYKNTIIQSCHIFKTKKQIYLVHYLQLFPLCGKPTTFKPEDKFRIYKIAYLLKNWNLLDVSPEDNDQLEYYKDIFVSIAKKEDVMMGVVNKEPRITITKKEK
jgi:hypothetical protein